ncbi:putative FkbM family methyltransferase [Nitratireductor aquimarinus]|uniref:FkbM family methyltransferase n=1 Tax=Nitratireductor aquimarinus TaxID=889300 RepID=UPI003B5A37A6
MRFQEVYKVGFNSVSVLMSSFREYWPTDDMVVRDISEGEYQEAEAFSWWFAMLNSANPGDVVVDAGAYSGIYSLMAAKVRPDTRCVAIEASSVTFGRLFSNILLNGAGSLINPNHIALSTKREIVSLCHPFGVMTMSSGESLRPTYDVDHTELVAGTTLDELLMQSEAGFGPVASKASNILPIKGIAAMKIDLEGVEGDVLEHAGDVLSTYTPPILIELLTDEAMSKCSGILSKFGYELAASCAGRNYVFITPEKRKSISENLGLLKEQGECVFKLEKVSSVEFSF